MVYGYFGCILNEVFLFLQGSLGFSIYQIARETGIRQEVIKRLQRGDGSLASADTFVSASLNAFPGAAADILKSAWDEYKGHINKDDELLII